jgi:pimeloyl-ACP methyl ester carboxylesterase
MTKSNPTVVLVHGAWADGSSWNKVIAILLAKGVPVVAAQLPLSGVADDLAATTRIMSDIDGDIVLVGHSWGGVAVTQAGVDPRVKAVVFVSAFAPDVGETGSGLIGEHPTPPALSTIGTDKAGFVYQTQAGMVENVGPDLPPKEARVLAVTQGRLAGKAFGETVVAAAWKAKPSWFVVTSEDRVVSVELQKAFATRMGATVREIEASHMSILSHPAEIAAVIEQVLGKVPA